MNILIIPKEIKHDINPYSGFISMESDYYDKTVKGLFYLPINVQYVSDELMTLITHKKFVENNIDMSITNVETSADTDEERIVNTADPSLQFSQLEPSAADRRVNLIISIFIKNEDIIRNNVPNLMRSNQSPKYKAHREDLAIDNPVVQLHLINKEFIYQTAKSMILSPFNLDPSAAYINLETNKSEINTNWNYTAASWQDGTWHPEHLFTENERNRENPYWVPYEVDYDSRSGSRPIAPGHRYNSSVYDSESQFPRWQYSMNDRPISRDQGGYAASGTNDRRVQRPNGYNMTALLSRTTY